MDMMSRFIYSLTVYAPDAHGYIHTHTRNEFESATSRIDVFLVCFVPPRIDNKHSGSTREQNWTNKYTLRPRNKLTYTLTQ